MKRRARSRDADVAAFGAEALPGGLQQIDETRQERGAVPRSRRFSPLGLATLIRLWRARGGSRRG